MSRFCTENHSLDLIYSFQHIVRVISRQVVLKVKKTSAYLLVKILHCKLPSIGKQLLAFRNRGGSRVRAKRCKMKFHFKATLNRVYSNEIVYFYIIKLFIGILEEMICECSSCFVLSF